MTEYKCKYCGKSFNDYAFRNRVFCSVQCNRKQFSKENTTQLICQVCGNIFDTITFYKDKRKYCSKKCKASTTFMDKIIIKNGKKVKWCGTCKQYKSIKDFCKNSSRKSGLNIYCKECGSNHAKKHYENNPVDPLIARKHYEDYISKYPWKGTWSSINSRCNYPIHHYWKKGIKNYLKKDDLKFLWFRDKAYNMKKPSIDRIDNDGHYTLENCRYIELRENVLRRWGKCLK